jgi:hypothetical protein
MRKEPTSLALALAAGLLAVPAIYALLRAWEVLAGRSAGPPIAVWSPDIALFRRVGVGAYVAGMVVPVVYFLARRGSATTARVLHRAAVIVAILGGVQAIFLP